MSIISSLSTINVEDQQTEIDPLLEGVNLEDNENDNKQINTDEPKPQQQQMLMSSNAVQEPAVEENKSLEVASDDLSIAQQQYVDTAAQFGIEIPSDYKINPDTYKDDYFKLITEGMLKQKSPELYEAFKHNISITEYFDSAAQLQEISELEDAQLYAFTEANSEVEARLQKNEFKSQEEVDAAVAEAQDRYLKEAQGLSQNALNKLVTPIRNQLSSDIKDLPKILSSAKEIAQFEALQKEESLIKKNVSESIDWLKQNINKPGVLSFKLSDAETTDKFIQFYNDQLTPAIKEGSVVTPFFEELSSNPQTLLRVMELYFNYKNGGIQSLKNNIRETTLQSVAPTIIKSNGPTNDKNGVQRTEEGIEIIDYSDPKWKEKVKHGK